MQHVRLARQCIPIVVVCIVKVLMSDVAAAQGYGHLFVAVADKSGRPAQDLTAGDFILEIGGNALKVASVDRDAAPVKVALLVDVGSGMAQFGASVPLREGLAAFLNTLAPQHEVGLFTIAPNVQRREDFTTDRGKLKETTLGLFTETGAGKKFLAGLFETWERRFEVEDSWPVIVVVLGDGGDDSGPISKDQYNEFVSDLIARYATVHVVLLTKPATADGVLSAYATNLTESTGGRFLAVSAATALTPALTQLAQVMNGHFDKVSTRYRVQYEVPADWGGGERISLRVVPPGLNLQVFTDRHLP